MNRVCRSACCSLVGLLGCMVLAGCAVREPASHRANPLGWPSQALVSTGRAAERTEIPLIREVGRVFAAVGEVVDAPALLVEGVLTANPSRWGEAGQSLLEGTGATVTSAWNLPVFWMPGRNIDLARDAELVNEALVYLESVPPERWRISDDDPRMHIFPKGTRVRADGKSLIYSVPGRGEVRQSAEESWVWHGVQSLVGTHFPAQERSWGFIVRTRSDWEFSPKWRAETILHEFYHQQMQMREFFRGWTLVYWPAYQATFPFTGWNGHWAEMNSSIAAGVVDRALERWIAGLTREPSADSAK